jgi:phenylacetate-coenzyme A ligase PaaK-like adenylate-forming protein
MSTALANTYQELRKSLAQPAGDAPLAAGEHLAARFGEWQDASGHRRRGFVSRHDFFRSQLDLVHALGGILRRDDVVVLAVPYALTPMGHVVERALELIGAAVISVGTSNTICPRARTLELMRSHGATSLVGAPSVALGLARAGGSSTDGGDRPSLRSLVAFGEACSPERLDAIAALWGARAVPLFGTPAMPVVATPCARGELHLRDRRSRIEVASRAAARVADGRRGELLVQTEPGAAASSGWTSTGELVELRPARQPCGESSTVVVPLGRADHALDSASGPISALDVEQIAFACADLDPNFGCIVRDGLFRVQCTPAQLGESLVTDLARRIQDRVRVELGVELDVTIGQAGNSMSPPPAGSGGSAGAGSKPIQGGGVA